MKKKVIIMGAAGRDFHNFNTVFRDNKDYNVVCFTAEQIPGISGRKYPKELAGKLYPKGIPIYLEEQLADLIKKNKVDEVVLSYSDLSSDEVIQKLSIAQAAGANFWFLGPDKTMIKSKKPVVAITAVRTGAGKSPATRRIVELIKNIDFNLRVVVVRHPMPYGDLKKQEVQRFATLEDLTSHKCTIEELEEYEPHIMKGTIVYAGIDYEKILRQAEKEADVIIWDGGNNDFPFFVPDLHICIADCRRPGHEIGYYPGEINLRMADVVIANKSTTATPGDVDTVLKNIELANPKATVMKGELILHIETPEKLKGKRVLAIEDGPTLTHGGMKTGAATIAAERYGAFLVSPRAYAVGSIKKVFDKYNLGAVLPAMGYSDIQLKELKETIDKTPCDLVIDGTPVDVRKHIKPNKPILEVNYTFKSLTKPGLENIIKDFVMKNVK